jgi:hypothetical protein
MGKEANLMEELAEKTKLLNEAREGFEKIDRIVSNLNENQMTKVIVAGEWTVREVLIHILSWQRKLMAWVQADVCGEIPEVPAPGMSWNEPGIFDILNAQAVDEYKDHDINEIVNLFRETHSDMMECLKSKSEDDLTNPARYPWMTGFPLSGLMKGCMSHHYEEHLEHFQISQASL